MTEYYRGGNSMVARRGDVRLDPVTQLVQPKRGVSVRSKPDGLDRFGGSYRLTNVPAALAIIQIGADPDHFEVVPAAPVSFVEYQILLSQIVLVPA